MGNNERSVSVVIQVMISGNPENAKELGEATVAAVQALAPIMPVGAQIGSAAPQIAAVGTDQ